MDLITLFPRPTVVDVWTMSVATAPIALIGSIATVFGGLAFCVWFAAKRVARRATRLSKGWGSRLFLASALVVLAVLVGTASWIGSTEPASAPFSPAAMESLSYALGLEADRWETQCYHDVNGRRSFGNASGTVEYWLSHPEFKPDWDLAFLVSYGLCRLTSFVLNGGSSIASVAAGGGVLSYCLALFGIAFALEYVFMLARLTAGSSLIGPVDEFETQSWERRALGNGTIALYVYAALRDALTTWGVAALLVPLLFGV